MFCKLICSKKITYIVNIKKSVLRYYSQTHYEVLKLPRDCSAKDIRNSFLKLSKEYHPDKTNNNTHGKFVKMSEAYNVLSKPSSRREYDLGLSNPFGAHHNNIRYGEPPVWRDETIWEYRDRSKDKFYESKPYYGIKGVKKISNFAVVVFCIVFTSIGVFLQIVAIRSSFTLKRDKMEKNSAELEELHSAIREQALRNGNEKQLEILKQKLNYVEKES